MNWIKEWLSKIIVIILGPGQFFKQLDKANNYIYPLKYLITSGIFSGLLLTVALILNPVFLEIPSYQDLLILLVVMTPITYVLGLSLQSIFAHTILKLYGKQGLMKTFEALSYSFGIIAVLSWLSILFNAIAQVLNIVIGAWVLYAGMKGLESFHNLSERKASVAIIFSLIMVIFVIYGLAYIGFYMG